MKCAIQGLALVPFALCALAGSASVLQSEKFGASFTNDYYRPGVRLCDTGTINGTWGTVAENVAWADEDDVLGKKYMVVSADDALVFTPFAASEKRTCSDWVSIRATAYEELSLVPVPTGARAAFAILAPEAGGKTNYLGWVCSQNRWTTLHPVSGASSISLDEWREVMVRFLKLDASNDGYVQYWLKRPDDSGYVPLTTEDGVSWIRTGRKLDNQNLGRIGFRGDGALERISGLEPNRGLIVGVGSWYDYLYTESIYKHVGSSGWEKENDPNRITDEKIRSYVIDGGDDGKTVTYLTSRAHTKENVEVTELEVQFTSGNDDESIPEDACARIRMVETQDGVGQFVCLVGGPDGRGQWKTNENWTVSLDAKYTVEISLLRMSDDQKFVSYRYKEGYGLEGGAYRDLFLNEPMLSGASGKTLKIDFDGYGIVHAIRGKDGQK